jgi:hypothetical protein
MRILHENASGRRLDLELVHIYSEDRFAGEDRIGDPRIYDAFCQAPNGDLEPGKDQAARPPAIGWRPLVRLAESNTRPTKNLGYFRRNRRVFLMHRAIGDIVLGKLLTMPPH